MNELIKKLAVTAEPLKRYGDMLEIAVELEYELESGAVEKARFLSTLPADDFCCKLELVFREMYRTVRDKVMQNRAPRLQVVKG